LIEGFCSVGQIEEAVRFYNDMWLRGITPDMDMVSVSALIGLFTTKGKMDHAVAYLREIRELRLLPDSVIYTMVIGGFCWARSVTEALRFRDEMVGCGCLPDVVTYDALLNGLCKQHRLLNDHRLFHQIYALSQL
jgi:pentatricopeptide repeat protein